MRTKFSMKKKTAATITAGFLVAGTAAGAYAYWTTTGSGTGSSSVAASNGVITLHGSFPVSALTPGGSQTVSFTADNPGTSSLYVGTVTTVVTTSDAGCLPGDFAVAPVAQNFQVPAHAVAAALPKTGTITMADTTANQDACKGATITLTLTSN